MNYSLRPYQQEAVNRTLRHFRRSRHPAVIVLPTGAGKSLIIAELARLAKGRVLVLAHVKELVEQNFNKYSSYGLDAGIFSAGLSRKDISQKVIFGGIQSVARAPDDFYNDFSLLIIDECHRISRDDGTQYAEVISRVLQSNKDLCVLGLTATPYRLDSGWIYQFHESGVLRSQDALFFKKCIYELPLSRMIADGYLTPPVQIDAPVASYDFSELNLRNADGVFPLAEIEAILKSQSRVTPAIMQNILELSADRRGVLIFTASVRHANEVLQYLPSASSAIVVGDTENEQRESILQKFRNQEIKYLVNVSVLTTGFDAPHVDLVAILRPTESVGLYQQIVGRGLRLYPGKQDCLILDYTGVPQDIYSPAISDRRPDKDSVVLKVKCPSCQHENDFWGTVDSEGKLVEHFGRKCSGAIEDPLSGEIIPCGFRYRYVNCEHCGAENDIGADNCATCGGVLQDDQARLAAARLAKDTHVMRPDSMSFSRVSDARGRERLEIRYYDLQGQSLSEVFFFDQPQAEKIFYYNFIRMHYRTPGLPLQISSITDALDNTYRFRQPLFVIARKQGKYWRIREKIFY